MDGGAKETSPGTVREKGKQLLVGSLEIAGSKKLLVNSFCLTRALLGDLRVR